MILAPCALFVKSPIPLFHVFSLFFIFFPRQAHDAAGLQAELEVYIAQLQLARQSSRRSPIAYVQRPHSLYTVSLIAYAQGVRQDGPACGHKKKTGRKPVFFETYVPETDYLLSLFLTP